MASNNLDTIGKAIQTALQTVTDFKEILDYEPFEFRNLPAACCFYAGFQSDDKEAENTLMVTERFIVRLFMALRDVKMAQDDVKALIPKVRKVFRDNRNLSGTVFYTRLTEGDIFVALDKNNPQMIATLVLECVTLEET